MTAKTRERKVSWDWPWERVLNRFYGIRDFPYLKIRIRDLRTRSRRDSALKVCGRVRMPEIPLGITWLHEILSRDYGIEGPYWGPSWDGSDFQTQLFVDRILFNHFKLYLFSTISMAMLPNTDVSKNLVLQIQIYTIFYACLEYWIDERNCYGKQELYLTADLVVFLNLNKWKHLTTMLPFALPRAT